MADLVVRHFESDLVRALEPQAAQRGHSAEAEHRDILRRALRPAPPLPSLNDVLTSVPRASAHEPLDRIGRTPGS